MIHAGVEAGVLDLHEGFAPTHDQAGGECDGLVLGGGLDEADFVLLVEQGVLNEQQIDAKMADIRRRIAEGIEV